MQKLFDTVTPRSDVKSAMCKQHMHMHIAKPDQSNAIYGALLDPTKGKAQRALQNLAHCALCQRMRIW
jgi:hypothetical protein